MSKLLVINQYYAPSLASTGQLAAEICASLARRGTEVHVVAAEPCYVENPPEAPLREVRDGVHVYRVPMGRTRGRARMRTRILGYLRFLWGARKLAHELCKKEGFEAVMTFHNPPFVGLLGAKLARKYGLRFVYVPYDIHPDILLATNWIRLPGPAVSAWERMNRNILKQADAVVALGEGMKRTLVEGKGADEEKVHVIPLWGRPEFQPEARAQPIREELGIGDDLMLLYSGNLGIMHPLDPILDAAARLQGAPVLFLFVGDGAKRDQMVRRVESEGLENVTFLPFQSEERFRQLVASADACLVALEPGLERLAVPSRSFTFLSAGRPLVTLMSPNADVARIVCQNGCGWNVATGDELASLVRGFLDDPSGLDAASENARRVYESRFRREAVIQDYARVVAG